MFPTYKFLFVYRSETYSKDVEFNGKNIRVNIVDLSSSREYEVFRSKMYSDTDVFAFCYDVSDSTTAASLVDRWYQEVLGRTPKLHALVIGCKADSPETKESSKNAKEAAKILKCNIVKCSAKKRERHQKCA